MLSRALNSWFFSLMTSNKQKFKERYFRLKFLLHLPSPWKKINFNKGVRIAIIVSGSKVSCLKDVDDKVAKVFVIVDLKLEKAFKHSKIIFIFTF